MRVTQTMLTNNMMRNLNKSYKSLGVYQDQLATGKKINRPSDDPVVAIKGMNYRTNLTEIEQYQRNLSEVYNWMETSDAAIDKMTSAMHRVRELTVQASSSTNNADEKKSIAVEIEQLKQHIESIANTKVGNKYIFNGTNTTVKPIDLANGTPVPENTNEVLIEVSNGIKLGANVNGKELFEGTNPDHADLFTELDNLITSLNTNATDIDKHLAAIDSHSANMTSLRADLGARYNRVELVDDRLGQQEVIANRIISDNEDADIERVITDLKMQESVHRAALSVGARIIQPSILDFLR
ncbi:flagellar hook-associated protein FlgL [Cytobacillus suaedae]|nr:flagellar hook-associated protein FlgL [Cytobacillus suaedae]